MIISPLLLALIILACIFVSGIIGLLLANQLELLVRTEEPPRFIQIEDMWGEDIDDDQ